MGTGLLKELKKHCNIFVVFNDMNIPSSYKNKLLSEVQIIQNPLKYENHYIQKRILKYIRLIHLFGMPSDPKYSACWVKRQIFKKSNEYSTIKKCFILFLSRLHSKVSIFREIILYLYYFQIDAKNFSELLKKYKIDLVIVDGLPNLIPTSSNWIKAGKILNIKTISIITNWDHPTCRGYISIKSDRYLVWSKSMQFELRKYHDININNIHIKGSLIFNNYFKPNFILNLRELGIKKTNLEKEKYILFLTNSPNYPHNFKIISYILNKLPDHIHLVVRLHPSFLHKQYKVRLDRHIRLSQKEKVSYFFPKLENSNLPGDMSIQEMQISSSLVAHAHVVINMWSTMILDCLISKKNLINIDFDWEPNDWSVQKLSLARYRQYISRVLDNKRMYFAKDKDQLMPLINSLYQMPFNKHDLPNLYDENVKNECGILDGKVRSRMVNAIRLL